jgi:hypothetical protein
VSILTANCATCTQGVMDFTEILECVAVTGTVCSASREAGVANNAAHPGVWSTSTGVEIVEIDIRPGSSCNPPINLKSKGVVPVAILALQISI